MNLRLCLHESRVVCIRDTVSTQVKRKLKTYSNMLIGVVHHGNQHVEKHYQRNYVIGSKHGGSNKLCKLVIWVNVGHIQTDEAKYGPEQ